MTAAGDRAARPTPPSWLPRTFFAREPEVVARELLGTVITTGQGAGLVAVRITETEAYLGAADAASHAFRGETARNAVMFGPAGRLYLYFVYGMHWCANVVTGMPGEASAVLLRAGEVVTGLETARERRPVVRSGRSVSADRLLASGPARLAGVLGWGTTEVARVTNGVDLCGPTSAPADRPVRMHPGPAASVEVTVGPRVGVAAAADEPLRFWITGDPTVSAYRPRVLRKRPIGGG